MPSHGNYCGHGMPAQSIIIILAGIFTSPKYSSKDIALKINAQIAELSSSEDVSNSFF